MLVECAETCAGTCVVEDAETCVVEVVGTCVVEDAKTWVNSFNLLKSVWYFV